MNRKNIGMGSPKQGPSAEVAYLSTASGQRFIEAKVQSLLDVIDHIHQENGEKMDIEALREPLKKSLNTALGQLGENGKNLNPFLKEQNIDPRYHHEINYACAGYYHELHKESAEFRLFNNLYETVTTETKFCNDVNALADAYEAQKKVFCKIVNNELKQYKNKTPPPDDLEEIIGEINLIFTAQSSNVSAQKNRETQLEERYHTLSIEELEKTIADCRQIGKRDTLFRQVMYNYLKNYDHEKRHVFFTDLNLSFLQKDFRDCAEAFVKYNVFITLYFSNDYNLDFNQMNDKRAAGIIGIQHLAPTQRLPRLKLKLQEMVKEEKTKVSKMQDFLSKSLAEGHPARVALEEVESSHRKFDRLMDLLNKSGLSCDAMEQIVAVPMAMGGSMARKRKEPKVIIRSVEKTTKPSVPLAERGSMLVAPAKNTAKAEHQPMSPSTQKLFQRAAIPKNAGGTPVPLIGKRLSPPLSKQNQAPDSPPPKGKPPVPPQASPTSPKSAHAAARRQNLQKGNPEQIKSKNYPVRDRALLWPLPGVGGRKKPRFHKANVQDVFTDNPSDNKKPSGGKTGGK